jgi:hypothetical protein
MKLEWSNMGKERWFLFSSLRVKTPVPIALQKGQKMVPFFLKFAKLSSWWMAQHNL